MENRIEATRFNELDNYDLFNVNGGSIAGVGTVLACIGAATALTVAIVCAPVVAPVAALAYAGGIVACNVGIAVGAAEISGAISYSD